MDVQQLHLPLPRPVALMADAGFVPLALPPLEPDKERLPDVDVASLFLRDGSSRWYWTCTRAVAQRMSVEIHGWRTWYQWS